MGFQQRATMVENTARFAGDSRLLRVGGGGAWVGVKHINQRELKTYGRS